ncbi:MAG: TldD protein [Myxococcota bacterium]|jgi:TldD protein
MPPLSVPLITFPEDVYSDVRVERVATTLIQIRDGALEALAERTMVGAMLRVLKDGQWYYASTTDLDDISGQLTALAAAPRLPKQDGGGDVSLFLRPHVATVRRYDDSRIDEVDAAEKLALLRSREHLLARPSVRSWSATHSDEHVDKRFLSSKGADISFDRQSVGFDYSFTISHGEQTLTERFYVGSDDFSDLIGHDEALIAQLVRSERFVAEAEPITPGEYTVILGPTPAGIFAHESFGHKSEADFMLGDETMLESWPIGKPVGAPLLSIIDDGGVDGRGYVPYDDEGQPARRTWLIKDGVLTGRLHSAPTAAALDEATTGNARAMSFLYEPIVRMTNTWIAPGDQSREALFAGVEEGYFIETVKHGSGMSTFTLAPSLAWKIEQGQITRPVRISVATGTVFETLQEIDGVSDTLELDWSPRGGCGKMEQYPLPVGLGGPYVRVRRLQLS